MGALSGGLTLAAAVVAATAFTAGCAGSSEYMTEVAVPAAITAPADRATVVFVRPSGMGFIVNFAILDQAGNWLGDAVAQSHFTVALPAGEYMFVGWAENTAAMRATLAAGRIYYVEVTPLIGLASARVELEALTPRAEDWGSLAQWIDETKTLAPLASGAEYIRGRHDDAMHRVASARENWDGYSAEEKEMRTLRAEDGVAPRRRADPPVAQPSP